MNDIINYRGFNVAISPNFDLDVYCLAYCDDECSVEFDTFALYGVLEHGGEEGRVLSSKEYDFVREEVEHYIDENYEELINRAEEYSDFPLSAVICEELRKREEQPTYKVSAYYGKSPSGAFVALETDLTTPDWSKAEEFAHERLMKGNYVIISDTKSGKSLKIDPLDYEDAFCGNFPYKPDDLKGDLASESWKDIAKEEIAAVTNNTMKGCLVALENDDMIPANVINEAYELYCQDTVKEQISFEEYLLAKVEPYLEKDKSYYEERLVCYISERLSAIDTRLEESFNEQLNTKTPLDVLKECGYEKTIVDLGSFIDKNYRLSLMFSEGLDNIVTQQGHSVDKLANPITNSPFIQSVQRNLADIGAGLEKNAANVAALVTVKGRELLSMLNSVAHKVGDIALSADTTIGLYNDKGKGSSFSISLDKNAVLPSSSLSDFQIEQDGEPAQEQTSRGSITCALNIDLWGKGRLEISQTYHRKPKDRQSRDIERD